MLSKNKIKQSHWDLKDFRIITIFKTCIAWSTFVAWMDAYKVYDVAIIEFYTSLCYMHKNWDTKFLLPVLLNERFFTQIIIQGTYDLCHSWVSESLTIRVWSKPA